MKTTNLASLPARLAFGRPATVPASEWREVFPRRERRAAIALYNNCNVLAHEGEWVLIHATSFAASGIARQLGFQVWQVIGEPEHWVVNTSRIGVRPA